MVDPKLALGNQWGEMLSDIWHSPEFVRIATGIAEARKKKDIFPDRKNVFKAFRMTPFNDVRIVWLGMDPYPNENATGLSFECGVNITPSFKKIFDVYEKYDSEHFNGPLIDGSLEHWAEQGVFLLNAALTVPRSNSGKHLKHWKDFTQYVLTLLDERKNPPVFVLLGKNAQEFAEVVKNSVKLKYEHPAYAHRLGRDWDAEGIFDEINKYINPKIEW